MSVGREIDVDIDALADYVFVGNRNNKSFILNLPPCIETPKDLFFFLLDLLCKGLVLLYGNGERGVDLRTLDQSRFQHAAQKLRCAGVEACLQTTPCPGWHNRINMPQLLALPNDTPLEDFVLEAVISGLRNILHFRLVRHIK